MIDQDNFKAEVISIYLKWSAVIEANKRFCQKNQSFFNLSTDNLTVSKIDADANIKDIVDFVLAGDRVERLLALNTALFSIAEILAAARDFSALEGKRKISLPHDFEDLFSEAHKVLKNFNQVDLNNSLDAHLLHPSARSKRLVTP